MERTDFEPWEIKDVARLLALVENQRRYYQDIVSSLPAGLVGLAANRAVVSSNKSFRQTFGLRVEDLRGKKIEHILPSDRLIEKIREATVHGIRQPGLILEHGGKLLRIVILPVRSLHEELEMETLLMIADVSDVRSAAAPVATPVAVPSAGPVRVPQAAFPVDALPAIVWTADAASFKFTAVNGAAEQILGYPPSHWVKSRNFFVERIHAEDRDGVLDFYRRAVEQSSEASAEFRVNSATGELIWCREIVCVAGPGIIAGVLTPIGQRKQAEQFQITAERISALRGLSGQLAHDFNNPLMVISGYAEEVLNTLAANDPRRGDLERILAAAARMSHLTAQLLQFTRAQAGAPEPVELSAIAGPLSKMGDVECRVAEPMWVWANSGQLEEVLLDLIAALRENSPERTHIVIEGDAAEITENSLSASLSPDNYVRLTVQSPGVDVEKSKAIFESFLHKEGAPAAGAALPRAYARVREWGGELGFDSDSSRGSIFTMYLRVAQPPAPAARLKSKPALSPVPSAAESPRETVLVVDDEAGIRTLIVKILRRERYLVLEAGTAAEALDVAARHHGPIHLVLSDVLLPDRNGRELATQLREALPAIKVIYISGFTDDESVRSGTLPPGARFIQKPFTLAALLETVRETFKQ